MTLHAFEGNRYVQTVFMSFPEVKEPLLAAMMLGKKVLRSGKRK